MWTFEVRSGRVLRPDGSLLGVGYSGYGAHRGKVEDESLPGLGPIPCGKYRIGEEEEGPHTIHVVMRLFPVGHDARGRSALELHGDSREHPGLGSHGCICLSPRGKREEVAESEDRDLQVVP